MAGSSVNSKGNSLSYHLENKPNEHLSDRFTVTPTNGSGYFDNEMVKQTMLAHEATFRKQVYELHRLYKIQKDLMSVQYQREEFNGHSRFADASQARSYSSHAPSGDTRRVWQVGLSSGHDIEQSYKKLMKGKGLEHSLNRVPSRHSNNRLDLQLPATACADDSDDDVEILEVNPAKSLPRTYNSILGRKVKLNLEGSSHMPSRHSNNRLDLQLPASADADDSDDDVEILEENPAKSLPRAYSSVLGRKVKLNIEGSSHMPSRHSNNRLDLQLPASADADDSDDDVEIVEENPAKSLPRTYSSVLGRKVKLNLEGSSHMPSRHSNNRLDLQLPASADADDSDDDVEILEDNPAKSLPKTYSSVLGRKVNLNLEGSSHMPPRHSNNRLYLQLPASAYADDSDDDVKILEEKPAKILPRTYSSVLGRKVKLNLEGSSHMNSLIAGLQPSHGSRVNVLNKEVEESSNSMKTTNFPYVVTSTRYSSAGVNLNLLSLQDNLKEKGIGESSGSKFFREDKEMRHNNSYIHQREDQSNMSWFKHKQNGVDSSRGHYMSSFSTCNPQILATPSSNATFKSPWQSSTTNYTTRSRHVDIEMPFAQNGFSMDSVHTPTLREYCRQYHSSKIHEEAQHQKHSTSHDCLKDINLNDDLRDITTTPEQESENTPMDILWIRKRLLNMKKSQVPSSCANGHSQILVGSTIHSEGSTSILDFPISTVIEKDSRCSSSLHIGTNSTLLIKGEANMEMQSQNKKDETNIMSLIDLNVALPFMDDLEIDVHQSEGDTVPQEPDDSSNESLDIDAANNLLAMCKDEFQAGSPQVNILLWFADLATSEKNTMVYSSESNNGDDSETLTLQLKDMKDYKYDSASLTQEKKTNEDHGPYAA